MRGVVHLLWGVSVEQLDAVSVDDELVVLVVEVDTALERSVDGVPAQEARPSSKVIAALGANDDSPQSRLVAAADLVDQHTSQQTPDASESIEDHITGLAQDALLGIGDVGQCLVDEGNQVLAGISSSAHQLAHVDASGREVELDHAS